MLHAAPDTCTCNTGYTKNIADKYLCNPICTKSCKYGKCVNPETCSCNEGYKLSNITHGCEPVCSKNCVNGNCTAPNTCSCYNGYVKDKSDSCIPLCKNPCLNGKCVYPNICSCNEGFLKSNDDEYLCVVSEQSGIWSTKNIVIVGISTILLITFVILACIYLIIKVRFARIPNSDQYSETGSIDLAILKLLNEKNYVSESADNEKSSV
ncbi:hypothetical protein RN001_005391 [Aquatica leii]|uniref:EGF-like domain-containing protein n=1 Tax=Aquatica leii TaxID=1421715 RepID=A0AAN7PBV7_9COLE|nr:hypothetical protein RN001_005391 [Aquatica leii]